jgi:hypothetical protein
MSMVEGLVWLADEACSSPRIPDRALAHAHRPRPPTRRGKCADALMLEVSIFHGQDVHDLLR